MSTKTYTFTINDHTYDVAVNSIEGSLANVTVNGVEYVVKMDENNPENNVISPQIAYNKNVNTQNINVISTEPQSIAKHSGKSEEITAPLPGVILKIDVTVGQKVSKGQRIAILEAMKMENEIESDIDGTVSSVRVHRGDSVLEGAVILTIEK